ncbi:MAG: hypothetical protein N4A33_05695 [Bacteriovoracaceae bacterium]|jgi:hypothetical protein|nr:hypothetical protein [Bacteriovoracaceae bacterium]
MIESDEKLRQTIIELERIKKHEKFLRLQSDHLVEAIEVLTGALDPNEILDKVFTTLNRAIEFDDSLLLVKKENHFCVSRSSIVAMNDTHIPMSDNFKRALSLKPIIIHNLSAVDEWKECNAIYLKYLSALYLPIVSAQVEYIFIFFHKNRAHFNKQGLGLVSRLAPIASQAFQIIKANSDLKIEIEQRKKVERENKKLSDQLVQSAYKEGFAQHAVSVLHNIGNLLTPLKINIDFLRQSSSLDYAKKIGKLLNVAKKKKLSSSELIEFLEVLEEDALSSSKTLNETVDNIINQIESVCVIVDSQKKHTSLKDQLTVSVNLSSAFDQVRAQFLSRLSSNGIDFSFSVDTEITLATNQVLFNECLQSFMENSIYQIKQKKLSDINFVDPIIEWKVFLDRKSNHMRLELFDNGIGLSTIEVEGIFKSGSEFSKIDIDFDLHEVANFINTRNGTIDCFSQGRSMGTKFVIMLPL